jgi:hypothetical protein
MRCGFVLNCESRLLFDITWIANNFVSMLSACGGDFMTSGPSISLLFRSNFIVKFVVCMCFFVC